MSTSIRIQMLRSIRNTRTALSRVAYNYCQGQADLTKSVKRIQKFQCVKTYRLYTYNRKKLGNNDG